MWNGALRDSLALKNIERDGSRNNVSVRTTELNRKPPNIYNASKTIKGFNWGKHCYLYHFLSFFFFLELIECLVYWLGNERDNYF